MLPRGVTARAALAAALTAACVTEPATQLLVSVGTDIDRASLLREVEVEVQDAQGRTTFDRARFTVGPPGDGLAVPFTVGVAPRDDDAVDVRVVLRGRFAGSGDRARVSATAITGYRRGRKLVLEMFLSRECVDRCEGEGTCEAGVCVPVTRVDPARLRDVTGAPYAPGTPDAGPACPGSQLACDGRCVDPGADTFHCGRCGNACADGSRCVDGACVSIGSCGPPYLPAGSSECVADYETGVCAGRGPSVRCDAMPSVCMTAADAMPARVYTNSWSGEVISLPRPARRLRFSVGGTGGAYCYVRLLDASGASLLQPEPRMNCDHPTAPRYGVDVDFTAPASSAGVTRIWLNHVSHSVCYLGAVDVTYDR
jgi:hypothetical protein